MQILDVVARQLECDRIELEQQIVAERAHQRESRCPSELRNSSSSARSTENADGCLLRSSSGNSSGSGFSWPLQRTRFQANDSQCGCGASTGPAACG